MVCWKRVAGESMRVLYLVYHRGVATLHHRHGEFETKLTGNLSVEEMEVCLLTMLGMESARATGF